MMKNYKGFYVKKNTMSFSGFIAYMTGGDMTGDCRDLSADYGCPETVYCDDENSPAETLIWDSFVRIRKMYTQYHEGLLAATALLIDPALDDFAKTFAPVPPEQDDQWMEILLELVSQATPMVGGKFFKYGELFYFQIVMWIVD